MSTFIVCLDTPGHGPRLAVKDIIDVEGVPTTAGSRAVERKAQPAARDAACLTWARAAGARIVGKTNLHELAMLPLGTNPWFGTPVNPLDAGLIPGGSSSGSAVAVAAGDADIALGSDTGGSIRVPAACCGVAGLKTTHGRISLDGVWPLAPSMDTIGPMARDVDGLHNGMALLDRNFTPAASAATRIGRLRTTGLPEIEAAVDDALARAELEVVDVELDFDTGTNCFTTIYFSELYPIDNPLVESDPDGVGEDIKQAVGMADLFRPGEQEARQQLVTWRESLLELFSRVELLALPTLPFFPPRLDGITPDNMVEVVIGLTRHTSLFNAAGVPCTAQPISVAGSALPASLQLVGPPGAEELLLPTAARVESALG